MEHQRSDQAINADERGAVLLETAISAGLFFFIILSGCELLRLGYNVIVSQFVATRVLRTAILGGTDSAVDRGKAIENLVVSQISSFGIDLRVAGAVNNPNVTVCAPIGADCSAADNAGEEDDIVSIRIQYEVKLLFGLVPRTVRIIVMGKNEPFKSV